MEAEGGLTPLWPILWSTTDAHPLCWLAFPLSYAKILGKFVGGMTGGGAPFSWNGEPLVKREAGLMEEEGRHMETSQDRRDEEEQASPIIHFGSMQRGDDAENNDPNVGMDDDETQVGR